jgi:hypothetical protein
MRPAKSHSGEDFVIGLMPKDAGDGRLLAREWVEVSDLSLARDETWWQGVRRGLLPADLDKLAVTVLPGESRGSDRVAGYVIELRNGDRAYRRQFSLSSLAHVARRAATRLVDQKVLSNLDEYSYFLTTVRPDADDGPADGPRGGADGVADPAPGNGSRFSRRSAPLVFETARLDDYMAESELLEGASAPVETEAEPPMPVFVSDEVWQEGHELARRGGERESAGVLTGRLMRDSDSPAVFVVLDACIEAQHAAEEKFSVTFSGDTWGHCRAVLDQRRRHLNRPHERFVGSLHGHNFMPEADAQGRRQCDLCTVAKICSRSTAVASTADFDWHSHVFVAQPWAVLLVWGYNAREQEDWRLYGLSDGGLAPRSIRRLRG